MDKDNYILCQKCQTNPCECGTFEQRKLKEFENKFFETYKDIPPSVLAMIWVDIEEILKEQKEEIKKQLINFRINKTEPWATLKRLRKFLEKL